MTDLATISREMAEGLGLTYEPVGVRLIKEGEALPARPPLTEDNLKSYCQAAVLAGRGRPLLVTRERMGCKLGTTALGMETEVEHYLDDGILEKYGVGLFATEEASAATMQGAPMLEAGRTRAALIAPLSFFTETPQVLVFLADSEQVMWLLYAANYDRGGRMDLPQSGGALGGCADITVFPLLTGQVNVTFLGLGCRVKMGLDPCHLMLGAPGSALTAIHTHLQDLAKPINMLRQSRGKS
ncbi:MAG: hypothetical protein FJ128_06985 [Deltaproteobacteria bacterium]|nr:hypothetical protein [Deltaproteobacteria bacterium]